MFSRFSKLFRFAEGQGARVPPKRYGPFVTDEDNELLTRVLERSAIGSNQDTKHLQAYALGLGDIFNSDVMETIGLLEGNATENTLKSKIVFYTEEPPVLVNDQLASGQIVAFPTKENEISIRVALTSSKGEVQIHDQELVSDIENKLLSSIDTLTNPNEQTLYRQTLADFLDNISKKANRPGNL